MLTEIKPCLVIPDLLRPSGRGGSADWRSSPYQQGHRNGKNAPPRLARVRKHRSRQDGVRNKVAREVPQLNRAIVSVESHIAHDHAAHRTDYGNRGSAMS